MKKYLFTESQIKKVLDHTLNEQTDNQLLIATVQCFLSQNEINQAYQLGPKLVVDGKSGPGSLTETALIKFQQAKIAQGHRITADGQWGYRTQETLTDREAKIWAACRKRYERR